MFVLWIFICSWNENGKGGDSSDKADFLLIQANLFFILISFWRKPLKRLSFWREKLFFFALLNLMGCKLKRLEANAVFFEIESGKLVD